jgi:3-hydroxyisobutyrate dehydrogenase-like beta-hydroxyacid dehydrogenase
VAAGKLHILVSGDPAAVDAVTPVLPALGQRFWEFGPDAASASVVKIGVNYLLVHTLQALSESVVLLERQGLDTDRFISLLNDSVFPGPAYGGYGRMIASSTYTPVGFSTTLGLKDLMLAPDVADGLGVDLPTGPALREVFETAADQVGSDLDWSCVAEVTRRRSAGPARPDAS